jgi:hypothetical protein
MTVSEQLRHIQKDINENVTAFCYHGPSGTKDAFLTQAYKRFTKHHNILVYPFCLETRELGNRIGNYFHELTCAEAAGLHFIAIHPQWDITNSLNGNITPTNRLAFLEALPDVIVHSNPLDRYHASERLNKLCKCNRYCWQHSDAPWVNRTATIRTYVQKAVNAYVKSVGEESSTEIDAEYDLTNAAKNTHLPLIPDVAMAFYLLLHSIHVFQVLV